MVSNISPSRKFGYIRVSSESQSLNSSLQSQKEQLIKEGIPEENIFKEIGSATDSIQNRPVFSDLIENVLREDDLLMVTKIDRCSRDTLSFLNLQQKLFNQKIHFISLDLPYSNDPAVNQLIATNLAAIATFETQRRKERQKAGILAAKKAGKYKGRKTVIHPKLIQKVKYHKETNNLSVTEIAKLTGTSKATIYKVLKNELGYVSNRLIKIKPD